ncbi:MAG TPA: trimethylamine methyltransferase family protein [Actinomycetota bacterium]|nr:trimethylamine methyltransferase family protein [Actinomycetota bacterium]
MPERSIRSLPFTHRHDVLTDDEVTGLHERSLEILERVGVTTSNARLLHTMAEAGQAVDSDARRIRFDPAFVEDALRRSPSTYTLAARDPQLDLPLDGSGGYLATDGCPADVVDLETGERRPGTKRDLAQITRLADALPQIAFHWQPVSANDTPVPVRPIHETHAQLPNTTKHIQQMTAIDPFNARGIVEMAQVVAGGSEELRARPIVSNFQCSISPLHWDEGPVECMRVFAEAGIPVGICAMPLAAASAPLSIAGVLAMANAEILSGIAILQTLAPGTPTMHISYAATIDLSSGGINTAWATEEVFSAMANTQLARRYDIPYSVWAFAPGAKRPDWQAGVQAGISGMALALSPGHLINGAGSLYDDVVYSPVELVLDAELFEMLVRFAQGFSLGAEDVAVDMIAEVGPGGHFLDRPHTLANMRAFWRDTVMDRSSWEAWESAGRPDPSAAAAERARALLAEHEPESLPEDIARELDRIVGAYERQALAEAR